MLILMSPFRKKIWKNSKMAATGSKMLPKFDVVQMESLISPLIKLIKLFKKCIWIGHFVPFWLFLVTMKKNKMAAAKKIKRVYAYFCFKLFTQCFFLQFFFSYLLIMMSPFRKKTITNSKMAATGSKIAPKVSNLSIKPNFSFHNYDKIKVKISLDS